MTKKTDFFKIITVLKAARCYTILHTNKDKDMKFIKTHQIIILLLLILLLLVACTDKQNNATDTNNTSEEEQLKWWQKAIAYEIYIRSFKDTNGDGIGDLNGITSELDYLNSIGVNTIWITPCYASPQADNGYDVADYYRIAPEYGTMDDMDNLIAEANKYDIKIVMDLVFNHTSDENEWFKTSRSSKDNDKSDWYIWADPAEDGKAPTNWRSIFGGSAWEYDENRKQYYLHTFLKEQPDLNWENPEVRKALIDVANFWINKGIDGFRLDAITYIKKPDLLSSTPDADDGMVGIHSMTANTDGILDFLHQFKNEVQVGKDIFTIGEANGVTAKELPQWVGEDGVFDMVFEFSHVTIDLPDESKWYQRREWTLPELKNIFVNSQNNTIMVNGWYPIFLENHDQPRSISHFLPEDTDRIAGGKALATLMMTMRGTPFIMQGQELGYINVDWPSIDYYKDISTINHYKFALEMGCNEQEAMEAVHHFSRDNSRTPMQWDDSLNAGFTSGEPWISLYDDYKTCNVIAEMSDPNSVLNWYIKLAKLRNEHDELIEGDYSELFHDDKQIFAYTRSNKNKTATILINMSDENASYDISCVDKGTLLLSTNSNNQKGLLAPYEAVIYEETK